MPGRRETARGQKSGNGGQGPRSAASKHGILGAARGRACGEVGLRRDSAPPPPPPPSFLCNSEPATGMGSGIGENHHPAFPSLPPTSRDGIDMRQRHEMRWVLGERSTRAVREGEEGGSKGGGRRRAAGKTAERRLRENKTAAAPPPVSPVFAPSPDRTAPSSAHRRLAPRPRAFLPVEGWGGETSPQAPSVWRGGGGCCGSGSPRPAPAALNRSLKEGGRLKRAVMK